jgi:integrase
MDTQAANDTSQTVTTPAQVTIPRRQRTKVLEVVQEMVVKINPATGKPVRHSRGKTYKVRRWLAEMQQDTDKPKLIEAESTERSNVEMEPTGRWRLNGYYLAGERVRRLYADEEKAKADLGRLKIESGNVDAKTRHALANRNDLVQDAIRAEGFIKPFNLTLLEGAKAYADCLTLLAPYGVNLRDVVKDYVKTAKAREKSITIGELVEKFKADRQRTKKTQAYLDDLRKRLRRFEEHFGSNFMASDVTADGIEEWLETLGVGARSQNNFKSNVGCAFSFAVKRDFITANPFLAVEKIKEQKPAPAVFTPKQAAALLAAADTKLVPFLAIGLFAGLRPDSEMARMDWSQVDFDAGLIEVTTDNKTASRRLVTMSDNLKAWLAPYREAKGKLMPTNCRNLRYAAMKDAGVKKWVPDVMRHSFASYHLAMSDNASKTALELGHSTTKTLFEHYRNLVKPDAAKAFWSICPPSPAPNVVSFTKGAAA